MQLIANSSGWEIFLWIFIYLMIAYYLIASLFYFFSERGFSGKQSKYKLQNEKTSTKKLLKEAGYSAINIGLFATTISLTLLLWKNGLTLIYDDVFKYGLIYYLLTILGSVFIHSTYFYWTHRMLHLDFFFKFHKLHHSSHTTSPFTSYFFHPVEGLIVSGVVPLMAFLMPIHWSVIPVFLLIMTVVNIYGHAGYEFFGPNIYNSRFGKFLSSATHHVLHHEKESGNYGIYFTFWDSWMKSERPDFKDRFNNVTNNKTEVK